MYKRKLNQASMFENPAFRISMNPSRSSGQVMKRHNIVKKYSEDACCE